MCKKFKRLTALCDEHCIIMNNPPKKELTFKDCYYIRYVIMRFISKNIYNLCVEWNISWQDIDENCFFTNNELQLNNGYGFRLDDKRVLSTAYLTGDCSVVVSIYNEETDKFLYLLVL